MTNDKVLGKSKIEAIYPLSTMQTGLLFHHLTEKEDRGFLNVQCIIDGNLDIDLLKKSWDLAIKRHPVLRTSVHWNKVKKPVQVILSGASMNWTILDWSNSTTSKQLKDLSEFKINNKKNGVKFHKNPLSEVSLIKTKPDSFYFIWSCHHLLLDGWSSSIILKDVFTFYDALFTGKDPKLENIPTYKSYLNWQKKIDVNDAKTFWRENFKDCNKSFLFNENQHKIEALLHNHIDLSIENTLKAEQLAKYYQTTLNTLFQGIWSIIIAKYTNRYDVVFGNTVSGRSGDFPSIELISGMFTNVIPLRTILNIDDNLSIKEWLKNIQSQQLEARKYEHITIDEITEWIGSTSNSLFDSLFIFENYPWNDIDLGDIKVHSSESGITTTYPLTITIKTGKLINIDILSEVSLFSTETNEWILNRFEEIINILHENKVISIQYLLKNITPIDSHINVQKSIASKQTHAIVAPKNKTEIELLKIWQILLNKNAISSDDNFFEIGGKSLIAVRLFSMIEKRLNIQLSPTTILEHSTISSLAKLINNESSLIVKNWNNLVPLRSTGNKNPIFCVHAGGGHVFFYNLLVKYLDENRPVFAIQPSGLFGKLPRHNSIEEMAIDYVNEILKAYPEGPYNLLVYCHSTAVGFEMSNLLNKMGHKANLIVTDTMAEQENMTNTRIKMRVLGFLKRLTKKPVDVIGTMFSYRYKKLIKPFFINIFGSTEEKNTSNTTVHLINVYNNYKWKSYNLDITLVLTEKVNKLFNEEITSSWNKITNHVNIIKTEGDHRTLFDDPDVKFFAKTLDDYLE